MRPEEEKKQASVETTISGSLPSAETRIDGYSTSLEQLLGEALSNRELALIQRFNAITSREFLEAIRDFTGGEKPLTVRELAHYLDMPKSTVQNVMSGKREPLEGIAIRIAAFATQKKHENLP